MIHQNDAGDGGLNGSHRHRRDSKCKDRGHINPLQNWHRLWFPSFNFTTGESLPRDDIKRQRGIEAATAEFRVLLRTLQCIGRADGRSTRGKVKKRGWGRERIHVIGYGDGATVALEALVRSFGVGSSSSSRNGSLLLGSVVAVDGTLSPSTMSRWNVSHTDESTSSTLNSEGNNVASSQAVVEDNAPIPILLMSSHPAFPGERERYRDMARVVRRATGDAAIATLSGFAREESNEMVDDATTTRGEKKRKIHGFLASEGEVKAVMKFLAQTLVRPTSVPEGAIEISSSSDCR